MKKKMKVISAAALLLLSMGLSACSEKIPPEEAVKQRVLARWEIRKAGKVEGLYEFLSPAQRQITTQSSYESEFGTMVEYIDVKLNQVTCKVNAGGDGFPDVCTAKIAVKFKTLGKVSLESSNLLTENWVYEDGQWWISP